MFEYWTHALSYVPTADMRFFVRAMKEERRAPKRLVHATVTRGDLQKVLGRIRRNGALTIRDIDDDVLREKDHEWASRKPSKRALQLAFYRGVLTVSQREGMLKTYELMTRHFGFDRLPKPAPESGAHRLSARPRVARARRRQPRLDLPSRRAAQGGDRAS